MQFFSVVSCCECHILTSSKGWFFLGGRWLIFYEFNLQLFSSCSLWMQIHCFLLEFQNMHRNRRGGHNCLLGQKLVSATQWPQISSQHLTGIKTQEIRCILKEQLCNRYVCHQESKWSELSFRWTILHKEVTIKDVSLLVDCLTAQITMQRLTFVWYASHDLCFAVEKTISLLTLALLLQLRSRLGTRLRTFPWLLTATLDQYQLYHS